MTTFGYQASHEQFAPGKLIVLSKLAEEAGFTSINASDHFHPWSERQGQSGYVYSWLGAALQATTIPCGVVTAPGQRQHPAIIAQAAATLSEMFPNRFWMALGTGEALNEKITGEKWPAKSIRNQRLLECFDIIKRLLNGELVSHSGHVTIENAKLYTLPKYQPLLLGAALTPETAEWMGSWAEGLLTAHKPINELKEIVNAFKKGGGEEKPVYLQVQLGYGEDEEKLAADVFHQWRTNIFPGKVKGDLWKVEQFDALGEFVTIENIKKKILVSSNIQQHIDSLKEYTELGFEKIILHNVGRNQEEFINVFGEKVLPKLNTL
ncbi:MAG: TIGR03885 family FMN-dependent LLM class oxidoreductase [Chitinophagales bacterium]|nr:TIGR03885 family FMN-dependent LLM class oxidoreductase [Chitinophagales bacterium]